MHESETGPRVKRKFYKMVLRLAMMYDLEIKTGGGHSRDEAEMMCTC